jgi:hypothetical protein
MEIKMEMEIEKLFKMVADASFYAKHLDDNVKSIFYYQYIIPEYDEDKEDNQKIEILNKINWVNPLKIEENTKIIDMSKNIEDLILIAVVKDKEYYKRDYFNYAVDELGMNAKFVDTPKQILKWYKNLKFEEKQKFSELFLKELKDEKDNFKEIEWLGKKYKIGFRANLRGANLRGIDLRNEILIGAKLVGADLTGAILTGAILTGADLTRADLTGAILTGKANLRSTNLDRAELIGAVLTGADLTAANVIGADFTGADLTGVDLTGVDFTLAKKPW